MNYDFKQTNFSRCPIGWIRKEIAKFLRISLKTLTDWTKRGLPSHWQRGRDYFDKNEVLDYIKEKRLRQFKVGSKLHHLKCEVS